MTYAEKVRFAALSKQAIIGKWEPLHTPNVGLLDMVGNDRKCAFERATQDSTQPFFSRQAWIALSDMSKEEAMQEFIQLLLDRCPMFKPYLQAHHVDNQEKDRLK